MDQKTHIQSLLNKALLINVGQRAKIQAQLDNGTADLSKLATVLEKAIAVQTQLFQKVLKRKPNFFAEVKGKIRTMKTDNLHEAEAKDHENDLAILADLEAELENIN